MKREKVTEKLVRILTAIDRRPMPVAVKQVYVFGSYARGALDCGDLDLVIVTEQPTPEDGRRCPYIAFLNFPDYGKAFSAELKSAPGERVQLLVGHGSLQAALEGSKIKPGECVLLWDGPGSWSARVESIPTDPNAGRTERKTYQFQGQGFGYDHEEVMAWFEEGIESGAVLLEKIQLDALSGRIWPEVSRQLLLGFIGPEMAEIMQAAATYIAEQGREPDLPSSSRYWLLESTDGSIRTYLGKPRLRYLRSWLQSPAVEIACGLPYPTRRREPCLWVFRKGEVLQ